MSPALTELLGTLRHADVRRLAWAIASPSLFDAAHPDWQGRLRNDAWSDAELLRCRDWLLAMDAHPERAQALSDALGDPLVATPLGIAVAKNATGPGYKVYVCHSPHLYLFEDKDGDGKADGPPTVLLTGFGGIDHDHGIHGIHFGPDGNFYVCSAGGDAQVLDVAAPAAGR